MTSLEQQILFTSLGALVSAFLGTSFAIWVDHRKTPNIALEVGEIGDDAKGNYRFTHLKVTNLPRKGLLKKAVFGNKLANYSKVQLEFLDPKSKKQLFSIQGRWASTAQPVAITDSGIKFNDAQAFIGETETILSEEDKPLDVALKFDGEDEFYGFNNWSYIREQWKNPDWRCDLKEVLLRAHFRCDSSKVVKEFIIVNPGKSIKEFQIKEVKH